MSSLYLNRISGSSDMYLAEMVGEEGDRNVI